MTSKFKAVTEPTPPLSSAASIGELEQPLLPSAKTDNTKNFTPITKVLSEPTRNGATTDFGQEKILTTAQIMKVSVALLIEAKLIRHCKVLSKDMTTVEEIQLVFDPKIWTENFDLKVLSEKK